jgi:hypothetical protein
MGRWVIMNTKRKMNIIEAIKWFNAGEMTIIHGLRTSSRGAVEDVYILGASTGYGYVGNIYGYVTDTGRGYGGTGQITVLNILTCDSSGNVYDSSGNIIDIENSNNTDKIKKLPVWVFK